MSRHAPAGRSKTTSHPHEKPHHPHWPLAALLFSFVFALGLLSVHETATWLHLTAGKWIVAHKAIPGTDPFSYTVFGRPWTTDSWLADVLFYLFDKAAGPMGVALFKSAVLGAGFALLLPVNPASPVLAAGVLGLGALSAWTGFTERPAVFDFLMLALMIRALRPRRLFHWTMVFHVAGIELLWANLHGTTAALGVWLIALKVMKTAMRTEKRERWNYLGLLVVAALALLCNPHGAGVLSHAMSGLEASAGSWQSLSPWLNLQTAFLLGGAAACAVTLQQEFFLTMTAASLVGLGLLVPALRPLAVLAAGPAISLALGHFVAPLDDAPERVARVTGLMTAALGLHALMIWAPLGPARGYPVSGLRGASEYMAANDVRGRMFNDPEAGPMLVGAGGRAVFVDSRVALYGRDFLADAASWPETFSRLSDIFRFDYAVVLNRRAAYPARTLDEDAGWALLYADDAALVYARRSGANAALAAAAPKRLLAPNQLWPESLEAALETPGPRARVLAELDAWIVQTPDGVQPLLWKARALDALKMTANADRYLALARSRPGLERDPELLACLGYVLERRGDEGEASAAYARARKLARRRGESALLRQLDRRP